MLLVRDDADPIWLINTDKMMDFTSYFPMDNPNNISNKIFSEKRKRTTRFKL